MPTSRQKNSKKNSSALSSPAADTTCDDAQKMFTNSDVDNALLNFDTVSNSMMGNGRDSDDRNHHLMPRMNFDSGSVGTRSPSPSDLSDSLGSKRSRREMDDEAEDKYKTNSAKKRAASRPASAPIDSRRADRAQGGAPFVMIQLERERERLDRRREGRCPDCGLETHSLVRRHDGTLEREPLNIKGEVSNGSCLFCNPLDDVESRSETSSQQFIHNVQHSGLSPITSSALWPSGVHNKNRKQKQSPSPQKQSPVDHARLMSGRNGPTNMYQNKNKTTPPMRLWAQRRKSEVDLSVSSVSNSSGLETIDTHSNPTDDGDEFSLRSERSQNSGGMGKLGNAIASGMEMIGDKETPRKQHQQRNRAPDPPFIPKKSPKLDTPVSMNSRAIVRKQSSEEDVQREMVIAHSNLPSSIYHHHQYPLENGAEQAFIEKTRSYLESGSGDICDVVVAMRRFPFSLSIQRVACEKLYVHCFERDHAHAIGLAGGIRTIIDAMEYHSNDVTLQQTCAGMIKHLACASPYNLDMLDRMGAVGILMATMECHSQNAMLLEACCWAIEGMARFHSPAFKMRVARDGGIHAAMKAVETFPDNDSLVRAAFHCLRQLGYNPSSVGFQQQQHQTGGVPQCISMDNGNQKKRK